MKFNPILGSATGKVGDVVLFVKNGVQMGRKYQPTVYNPNTMRQRISRARMSMGASLARVFRVPLEIGFGAFTSTRVSGFNLGVKQFVPTRWDIITGETLGTLGYDYTAINISKGPLPTPLLSGNLSFTNPSQVAGTLTDRESAKSMLKEGEKLGLVVTVFGPDVDAVTVGQFDVTAVGSDSFTVDVPASWQGMKVYVYAFYKVIPESHNGVDQSTAPWMFPSDASWTAYLGFGNIS